MKLLNADHEYDGFIRRETRTEEYELHEDLLLLAGYAEAAAKAAYLFEHSSDKSAKANLISQYQNILGQLTKIKGYHRESDAKKEEQE